MITIKEIAQQAGFSPSTVSRLLSNDPSLSVSPETKQKILNTPFIRIWEKIYKDDYRKNCSTILDYWNRRIRRYIF